MQTQDTPVEIKLPNGALILILGLLSMLMPLSIDLYLSSVPNIGENFQAADGTVQLTISLYLVGAAVGQLLFGPLTDSYGRRNVLLLGLMIFVIAALSCAIAANIDQLIIARFFHGIAAAATTIIVNALMKDIYQDRDEFSKMMSFVMLVSNIAPLLAPIIGGYILYWFNWQANFYVISGVGLFCLLLVAIFIPETLPKDKRDKFSLLRILSNFIVLFRHRQAFRFMLLGAFAGAGLFSFLSSSSFVYMNIHGVDSTHFGYYFAINICVMVLMNTLNSRFVKRVGAINMMQFGLTVQFIMSIGLIIVEFMQLSFPFLVACVAGYIGCIAVIGGNSMAVVLNFYPRISGTASSLAGTLRFMVAGAVGILISLFSPANNTSLIADNRIEWLMVGSMVICNFIAFSLFLSVRRSKSN